MRKVGKSGFGSFARRALSLWIAFHFAHIAVLAAIDHKQQELEAHSERMEKVALEEGFQVNIGLQGRTIMVRFGE